MEKVRLKSYLKNGFIAWIDESTNEMDLQFPAFKPLNEVVAFAKENKVTKLRINNMAWRQDNLEDLKHFPNVHTITFSSKFVKDFSALQELPNLRFFALGTDAKVTFDLMTLPKVTSFSFIYGKHKILNLENANGLEVLNIFNMNPKIKAQIVLPILENLKVLNLDKFNPESSNFDCLPNFPKLEKLTITNGKIESLNGIKNYTQLTDIHFYGLNKLKNLSDIEGLSALRNVSIENAKGVANHEILSNCSSLETLSLLKCGTMKNLEWIAALARLKVFNFYGTDVANNDLSPLLNKKWEHLNFSKKRNYSHKLEQMNMEY